MPCIFCQMCCDNTCLYHRAYQYHALIEHALRRFIKEDRYLSELDVNERSQTHKLAEYIQQAMPEYNVDCEFNKNLTMDKVLDFTKIVEEVKTFLNGRGREITNDAPEPILDQLRQELENPFKIYDEGDLAEPSFLQFTGDGGTSNEKYIKRVFPDIITHLRGTSMNKVVIEAKKESNKNKKARWFDLIKLGLFTETDGQFGYDAGYFIELPSGRPPRKFKIKFEPWNIIRNSNVFIVKVTSSGSEE